MRTFPLLPVSFFVYLTVAAPGYSQAGQTAFVPDPEAEISLGRRVAAELEQYTSLISDPGITGYVDRVTQSIVRHSDVAFPFTVKVLDSDSINAVALPGGFLYLTRGLILTAESEAELAGLIAHHVGHITARHAVAQGDRRAPGNMPASIFLNGIPARIVLESLTIGVPISFVAFGRDAEEEADLRGLEYMVKSGYDPTAMLRFFERLQAQAEVRDRISPLFSTHPQPAERIRMAEQHIAKLPSVAPDFDAVRERLRQSVK